MLKIMAFLAGAKIVWLSLELINNWAIWSDHKIALTSGLIGVSAKGIAEALRKLHT